MDRIATNIIGNLYFSGTYGASTHIVDTGDGLLLFDTGYPSDTDALLSDMKYLGMNPVDIRWIMHTHGHIDHMGGTRRLVSISGAKTYIGAADADAAAGRAPLSFAEELGMKYDTPFEPDETVGDGDVLVFGNTAVACVATPGHTAGAMSYFFEISADGRKYRAGLHGGAGVNSVEKSYLDKHHLPYSLREDFIRSMKRLEKEHVDIFLGNHMAHNDTAGKYERLKNGDSLAFVNPDEWTKFNEESIKSLESMLAKESGKE